MFDIVIENGRIIDGTGNTWYHGEIGIEKRKIACINPHVEGITTIDADNMVVCPGFIDMHSHTDFVLPFFNTMESYIRQGITTCVVGMCGSGLAPIHPDRVDEFKKNASTFLPLFSDLDITWHTFAEYMGKMELLKFPSNLAFVLGYENVRLAGGAAFENRLPTLQELETMKEYVREAMEAGSFGMSTGLIYAPQTYAQPEELIELAAVVARYKGLYFSHIRGEGETVIDAVKEFIRIVEESGCRGGQIAHLKVSGRPFWGKSREVLQLIEEANNRGINVTFDSYPYNRGCSSLVTALPPWVHEGGPEKIMERLRNPDIQERIRREITNGLKYESWENWIKVNGFDHLFISTAHTKKWKKMEGKSISEITRMKGLSSDWETLFDILIDEELGVQITLETMDEEDIRRIMTNKYQMVGTDGMGIPHDPSLGGFHPRFYGTFPRILGKYVREEKVLTLEDAVRRMTSFPAQRLGLKDRGLLKENMWADIVIFNPDTVIDKATFEEPHQFPEGIFYVLVNGEIVVEDGDQVKRYPGKILKHST
ncbi:MAG: D-aminoacylase [Theionarchaea archaeon]|nr:D-aminoacylase [Theionarchaea archaeon]